MFLTPERALHRKGQELLLSFWLEHKFTKTEILELYLNRVYFGSGTYGVDAARAALFRPSGQGRDLAAGGDAGRHAEGAVALQPEQRSDRRGDARADRRSRTWSMPASSPRSRRTRRARQSTAAEDNAPLPPVARYFSDWALDQVSSYIGFTNEDLVVQTTLDPRVQGIAERNLTQILAKEGPKQNASEAALVSLTPDGAVRAMVGGVDYKHSQYNRATQAMRQPGSAFKAFVYPERLRARPDARQHLRRCADLDREMAAGQLQ